VLGYYPVRVLPSKTAILPVNPTFLPRVWILFVPFYFATFGSKRKLEQFNPFVTCSRMMSGKCVPGLSIVQILTKRYIIIFHFSKIICNGYF
jgi:Kef-type K+ transport system membrane component KefB